MFYIRTLTYIFTYNSGKIKRQPSTTEFKQTQFIAVLKLSPKTCMD